LIEKVYPPVLPNWLKRGGKNFEVVLASGALYVRNLSDIPFPNRLSKEKLRTSCKQLTESFADLLVKFVIMLRSLPKIYLISSSSGLASLDHLLPKGEGIHSTGRGGPRGEGKSTYYIFAEQYDNRQS